MITRPAVPIVMQKRKNLRLRPQLRCGAKWSAVEPDGNFASVLILSLNMAIALGMRGHRPINI